METFAKGFVRNPDGSWLCVAPVKFANSSGEVVTCACGTTYRRGQLRHGVDIALWLHNWRQFRIEPSGYSFPKE
jgi:hypothetical protein